MTFVHHCVLAIFIKEENVTFFPALQFLRQQKDVSDEIEQMKTEEALAKKEETTDKFTFFKLIKNKEYHLSLFLSFVLSVSLTSTGMSGVSVIMLYSLH